MYKNKKTPWTLRSQCKILIGTDLFITSCDIYIQLNKTHKEHACTCNNYLAYRVGNMGAHFFNCMRHGTASCRLQFLGFASMHWLLAPEQHRGTWVLVHCIHQSSLTKNWTSIIRLMPYNQYAAFSCKQTDRHAHTKYILLILPYWSILHKHKQFSW